ncbi:hypothetical protein F441_21270 [Phytophthora nicotianae CJ01A1]|uniref:Uncharacterized protein n=2 Tax=Phytophthora nicotianae TaxID=4792 RepID=W2Y4I2_PHYNI|nr:hypothetical protein F441_21270 [Phytophthora nicotianae CJ01A1]ETP29632.1 hypothetical protein F442_21218 [Phytophthora nicotianae P10297]
MEQLAVQRNVIVAWLEQGDHFLQATAFSTLSEVYPRPSVSQLQAAEQIECQALCKLAATVNAVVPQSHWSGAYARQVLQRYLMKFRAAARQASLPGFTVNTTDEAFGIRTSEDQLNAMCPHFMRLQLLHNSRIRAAMRGGILFEINQEKTTEVPYVDEYTHQGKVMPWEGTVDLQSIQGGTPYPPEITELPNQGHNTEGVMAKSHFRPDVSMEHRTEDTVVKNKDKSLPKELTPPNTVMKRVVSAKRKQREQQEKEKYVRMPNFTANGEDDDLPFFRSKARVIKSTTSNSEEQWLKRKSRREASPGKSKQSEQKTPPRATRSSVRTPTRVTWSTPNRIKKSLGNARKRSPKIAR